MTELVDCTTKFKLANILRGKGPGIGDKTKTEMQPTNQVREPGPASKQVPGEVVHLL